MPEEIIGSSVKKDFKSPNAIISFSFCGRNILGTEQTCSEYLYMHPELCVEFKSPSKQSLHSDEEMENVC